LKAICVEEWQESPLLDFKRELPSKDDRGRQEFLKDVCAFANSEGGDLIFGIEETNGIAKAIVPITTEGSDTAIRRLGQILDAGLEPRIQGVRFRSVRFDGGTYVLLVRVPASFDGPHRFTVNNASRFVVRSGTHISDLPYEQLRMAFDRTASLARRARDFRAYRLQEITAHRTWKPMRQGPLCVVHILPMGSMTGRSTVDVASLYRDHAKLSFDDWGGASRSINLDGVMSFATTDQGVEAYTHVFRSGAIEAVRFGGLTVDPSRKAIPSRTIAEFLRNAIETLGKQYRTLGISGPAVIGVAFLFVEGYDFPVSKYENPARADREHLVLEEVWIENLDSIEMVDSIARPILNTLWQAFGLPACTYYDAEGKWTPTAL
jgi:Schlafen, AlbA_2